MAREILIEKEGDELRAAVMDDGWLVDLFIERKTRNSIVGNIYLGRVERVIPGIGAAFIDIGCEKSGFLPLTENSSSGAIESPFAEGNIVFVQAKRDGFGKKGPQLSREISLPGRFLVYAPVGARFSVSRQIENQEERERLLRIINEIAEEDEGFVIRTVSEGVDHKTLAVEANYLRGRWKKILIERENTAAPAFLFRELSSTEKIIRDHVQDDVVTIRFDHGGTFKEAKDYCESFYPELIGRLSYEQSTGPLFDKFDLGGAIDTALSKNAPLPSGGGLVIESMEALTAIDVNSGGYIEGSNPDENALKTNLEAAIEVPRQVRLRNLGGLIVVDFIHMQDEEGWREVLDVLRESFSQDRVNCRVVGRTEGGLVELIRRRRHPPLSETLLARCPECDGNGKVWRADSLMFEVLRSLRREAALGAPGRLGLSVSPEIFEAFKFVGEQSKIFSRVGREVVTNVMPDYAPDEYAIYIEGEGDGVN